MKSCFAPSAHTGEGGAFVVEDGHLVLCVGNINIWGVVIINSSKGAFRTSKMELFRKKLHLRV